MLFAKVATAIKSEEIDFAPCVFLCSWSNDFATTAGHSWHRGRILCGTKISVSAYKLFGSYPKCKPRISTTLAASRFLLLWIKNLLGTVSARVRQSH